MTFMKYDLSDIVKDDHVLKQIDKLISFKRISLNFKELEKETGRPGYSVELGRKR